MAFNGCHIDVIGPGTQRESESLDSNPKSKGMDPSVVHLGANSHLII